MGQRPSNCHVGPADGGGKYPHEMAHGHLTDLHQVLRAKLAITFADNSTHRQSRPTSIRRAQCHMPSVEEKQRALQ